jgi:hypothetical protein
MILYRWLRRIERLRLDLRCSFCPTEGRDYFELTLNSVPTCIVVVLNRHNAPSLLGTASAFTRELCLANAQTDPVAQGEDDARVGPRCAARALYGSTAGGRSGSLWHGGSAQRTPWHTATAPARNRGSPDGPVAILKNGSILRPRAPFRESRPAAKPAEHGMRGIRCHAEDHVCPSGRSAC